MTPVIRRHPDAATLMSFAAGSLAEPLAAVMAAHVGPCPECRAGLRDMELLGAALLAAEPPGGRSGLAADTRWRIAPSRPPEAGSASPGDGPLSTLTRDRLPAPIARHYGLAFDRIPWRRLGPGFWSHRLALSPGVAGELRLLKVAAGRALPRHGHGGAELTLVLDGAFADETGRYRPGDVQDVDAEIEHRPVADAIDGCVCLIASERPTRFSGFAARLLQAWAGIKP